MGAVDQVSGLAASDPRWTAFIAVVAILVAVILAYASARFVRHVLKDTSIGQTSIVTNVIHAAILVVTLFFFAENIFHIQLYSLAQALGLTTLIVSLGLQTLITNVVAGAQIVLTRLFSVQDHLEIGDKRGEVMDIGWRQTVLRDKEGNAQVVPNATIMGSPFVKLEGKMTRRYLIDCDIKPGLDLVRVSDDICSLADSVLDELKMRAGEPTEVRYLGSTANGVKASIRIYLKDIEMMVGGMDAVMRAIGQRGYLADWTNDNPAQDQWR